jgi:hypothetical protein
MPHLLGSWKQNLDSYVHVSPPMTEPFPYLALTAIMTWVPTDPGAWRLSPLARKRLFLTGIAQLARPAREMALPVMIYDKPTFLNSLEVGSAPLRPKRILYPGSWNPKD